MADAEATLAKWPATEPYLAQVFLTWIPRTPFAWRPTRPTWGPQLQVFRNFLDSLSVPFRTCVGG